MAAKSLMIFTSQSPDYILEVGGTRSWALNVSRARECEYVVLCQNRYGTIPAAAPTEPHGQAFMIGRISKFEPTNDPLLAGTRKASRWLVRFDQYARLSNPNCRWPGMRNPVFYTTLDEIGIDPEALQFLRMPESAPSATPLLPGQAMQKAKQLVAESFGVDVGAVEITIRA